MDCAYCNGKADLKIEETKKTFRKEEFKIFEHYYQCQKCSKEFTTDGIDMLDINQVYNQYREKYSIPFPEQLTAIREKYNLSAARMSDILGFGPNQYRLYESGDIPAESQGSLLGMILKTGNFIDLVKMKKTHHPDYEKIYNQLISLKEKEDQLKYSPMSMLFNESIIPNENTGYKVPSLEKFANMVVYLIQAAAEFRVKLNKYLFYSDFLNYKNTGQSISGYNYSAIPLGPVPEQYGTIYDNLITLKYIDEEPIRIKGEYFEKFIPLNKFNKSLFSKREMESLDNVIEKLKKLTTSQVVNLSHQEPGWIKNKKSRSTISYQKYAFLLKNV